MTDLKELIEQEIDQYLEWPTADKSHVTTVSAKLFAEHVARMYADHIPDAGKMVSDQLRGGTKKIGRSQIREAFLRNGASIPADRDDLPDWVYESVFELLDSAIQQAGPAIQYVAPAVQGEPVGEVRFELGAPSVVYAELYGKSLPALAPGTKLYAAPQPAEQPAPDVAGLVEALEQGFPLLSDEGLDEVEHHCEWVIQRERKRVHSILAAHRKGVISHDSR